MRRIFLAAVLLSCAAPALAQTAPERPRRSPEARQKRQAAIASRLDRGFKRLDTDGNGVISKVEWPRAPRAFDRLDANKDGQLTPDELRKRIARHRRGVRR